jgi:unsaturated chondroitin disaccharide hydrolase
MIDTSKNIKPADLAAKLERFWELSGEKIKLIEAAYDNSNGAPVFTVSGKYTSRGWTEWTQGFQFGAAILQFDATGETGFLESGRSLTVERMAPHLTHIGVHDHGFNNVSTYGNLLRLMKEGKLPDDKWERRYYELAIKVSGAVQASRWTPIRDGGFIHSFNGPHSLFVDTIRSVRALVLSHVLGHSLHAEGDTRISLLDRTVQHLKSTAEYSVYYGEGRDTYDAWGRTAHESIFNVKDGNYRCPNSQQGYSGFSTWTRGLAWAILGFAEQLEWFGSLDPAMLSGYGGRDEVLAFLLKAARATSDFYIKNSAEDGIPYWDSMAPGLANMGDYLRRPSDPFNAFEPVDSSAAAIAAQGLLRLGTYLNHNEPKQGDLYLQAGLKVLGTLMEEPYLSTDPEHQGLILHSVYHRPNGWDHIPGGSLVPNGESSMWGDYHAREAALYLQRLLRNETYYSFFNI